MNKNKFMVIFVMILVSVGSGVYLSQKTNSISDLVLANVEALANDESNAKQYSCYKTISTENKDGQTYDVRYCGSCNVEPANYYSGEGLCTNR